MIEKILIDLSMLFIGMVIYQLMSNQPISNALPSMYWSAFGAVFVAVKYRKLLNKESDR